MATQQVDGSQIHLDFRGQHVTITALAMGTDEHDFGLLIRSPDQSVAIVLDAEAEAALFSQVFSERKERADREHLLLVPHPD